MTTLETITTTVNPTALHNPESGTEISFENSIEGLLRSCNLHGELRYSFDEGRFSEKNKRNHFTKILMELITYVLDQDDPKIENAAELLIHKQNKKFIKDTLLLMLNNIKNTNLDDKKVKSLLVGKVLQSLYDNKS